MKKLKTKAVMIVYWNDQTVRPGARVAGADLLWLSARPWAKVGGLWPPHLGIRVAGAELPWLGARPWAEAGGLWPSHLGTRVHQVAGAGLLWLGARPWAKSGGIWPNHLSARVAGADLLRLGQALG
ncbi:hypothetical protein E2562_029631 [Oryza meyeriana var. granulata]|uniref:Uncharacterized protein n=1 Tax=Oryza meyeriana var. granulata TaxID=110450 RepID=A0A6G1E519_9ORYZ|nr:hypothetical protein E2562_029631 [Oryza meyeriana var. granulata]